MNRRKSTIVDIGSLSIGGPNPIVIQSMTTTDTRDVHRTVAQIRNLESVGCQLVRMAVPNMEAAIAIGSIKKEVNIPVVADIHFDYHLALEAMKQGVDKLRINPGNIGSRERVQKVTEMARDKNIPIRIGVNAGSLDQRLLQRYGSPTAEALVESALEHIGILESENFHQIVLSLKASSLQVMVEAYRLIAEKVPYPLHLGVTEAGTVEMGTLKSAIGMGALLLDGIGDTIRVSLTADPVLEVEAGKNILRALGLLKDQVQIISCPTCGRCQINLIELAQEIERKLAGKQKNLTVAVMGCAVNGPGEAREADIGIAGGNGCALLFRKGEVIRKISEDHIVEELLDEIERF